MMNAGTYTARAARWAWDTDKSGTPCLSLIFRTADGAEVDGKLYFDTDRADTHGRTAADRSLEALRAMGLRGGVEAIGDDTGGLDQGDVSLVVEMNAKGYPYAKYVNAPRGSRELRTFAPPSVDAKRAFFAQMNARLGVAPAPTRPAAPARGFAPPAQDDDVPF